MKKKSLILTAVLMVVLLSTSITAVSAQHNESAPIGCVIDMAFDEYPNGDYWYGTVSGNGCSIAGTITFNETGANYIVGKTEHFFEEFTIQPYSGGEIIGYDNGVWNFSTFKFRANGYVIGASEEWSYLVGYKFHEMGTTSNPDEGLPVTAPATKMTLH